MSDARIEHGLLSPAMSQVSIGPATIDDLPIPRTHPIPAGSSKEGALINYIDDKLLVVTRRYNKSFAADPNDKSKDSGYVSFEQVISDLNPIIDVVWISATPWIQTQYLLLIAGHFRAFMHSFPFVNTSFLLARKFDAAFSTLLSTAATIPNSRGISITDKVRIRSLAEETRLEMTNLAAKSGVLESADDQFTDDEDEDDTDLDDNWADNNDPTSGQSITLRLGQVYEKTMQILGADLSSLPPPKQVQKPTPLQPSEDVEIIDL